MTLKTIVKLGTIVSVALFCIAVGFYAFMQLDTADRNRDVNLFELVPGDCNRVLESENINELLNEVPHLNYSRELEYANFPGLLNFLLSGLNSYSADNPHGLSSYMSRLLVSFHYPYTPKDQVVYFRMGNADEQILADMLQEYAPTDFLPKEEVYRDKTIRVYPLGADEYLASYAESGFLTISYQKRLLEQVIDAKLDDKSLNDDPVFAKMLERKKSQPLLTLYAQPTSLPYMEVEKGAWSDYDFHTNSDVLYLTGNTYVSDSCSVVPFLTDSLNDCFLWEDDSLLIVSQKDSVERYIEDAYEVENRSLFLQNVVNLSKEASFTMVADMKKVAANPSLYEPYFPPVILANAPFFSPFIFSAQYMLKDEELSHIFIFTYKD